MVPPPQTKSNQCPLTIHTHTHVHTLKRRYQKRILWRNMRYCIKRSYAQVPLWFIGTWRSFSLDSLRAILRSLSVGTSSRPHQGAISLAVLKKNSQNKSAALWSVLGRMSKLFFVFSARVTFSPNIISLSSGGKLFPTI